MCRCIMPTARRGRLSIYTGVVWQGGGARTYKTPSVRRARETSAHGRPVTPARDSLSVSHMTLSIHQEIAISTSTLTDTANRIIYTVRTEFVNKYKILELFTVRTLKLFVAYMPTTQHLSQNAVK